MIRLGRTIGMTDVERITDAEYAALQRRYGGQRVARRGAEVVVSAESFDELIDAFRSLDIDWTDVIVEYIDPPDVVSVY